MQAPHISELGAILDVGFNYLSDLSPTKTSLIFFVIFNHMPCIKHIKLYLDKKVFVAPLALKQSLNKTGQQRVFNIHLNFAA